jgi:hypothetical protein
MSCNHVIPFIPERCVFENQNLDFLPEAPYRISFSRLFYWIRSLIAVVVNGDVMMKGVYINYTIIIIYLSQSLKKCYRIIPSFDWLFWKDF